MFPPSWRGWVRDSRHRGTHVGSIPTPGSASSPPSGRWPAQPPASPDKPRVVGLTFRWAMFPPIGTGVGPVSVPDVPQGGVVATGQRPRPFVAAVGHGLQVGDGEVASAVVSCRGRGRRWRRGGPHRRGGESGRAKRGSARPRSPRAELGQPGAVGAAVGEEQALRKTEAGGCAASSRGPAGPRRAGRRPGPCCVEAMLPRLSPNNCGSAR